MVGYTTACVERYLTLSGKHASSLRYVDTPNLDDHQLDPAGDLKRGEPKESSAKIVLKVLYCARYNRTDFFLFGELLGARSD